MNINKLTVIPTELRRISSPPTTLFHAGATLDTLMNRPRVAIVGSRKVSPYGQQVTHQLARQLAEQGVVIISGLALGVDSIAHRAALEVKGSTLAFLPGPIEHIYPASHTQLARQIIDSGGALLSEYPEGTNSYKHHFITRNRLVAGLAQAVLITEAAEKSGSLHTARFAKEQGKPVLAVPGNITNPGSEGTNGLIKDYADAVTGYEDVLSVLGLKKPLAKTQSVRGSNAAEQKVLDLLISGLHDGENLLKHSKLQVHEFNQTLTMLEIGGKIRSLGSNQWGVVH